MDAHTTCKPHDCVYVEFHPAFHQVYCAEISYLLLHSYEYIYSCLQPLLLHKYLVNEAAAQQ
jgi:hypothetical protein